MALDNRLVVYNEQGEPVDYDILASDVKFNDGKDLPTKLAELEDEIGQGGYTPPQGGIPKTDLAQSVQDTLDDVANKVDKETGKGLSTNDYTTAEKTKLAGLPTNPVQSISVNGTAQQKDNGNVNIVVPSGGLTESDISVETQGDGTVDINVGSNTYTVNLNHTHENMAKLVVCEESDLPATLAKDTIYAQVDDADNPTEIETLYIAGLEFSGGGAAPGTPRLTSPTASQISNGIDIGNTTSGVATYSLNIKAKDLTQSLLVEWGSSSTGYSFNTSNLPTGVTYDSGTGKLTITKEAACGINGVNIPVVYTGNDTDENAEGTIGISSSSVDGINIEVTLVANKVTYEALTAIKLTGTQWLEADYTVNPNTDIEFKCQIIAKSDSWTTSSNSYYLLSGQKKPTVASDKAYSVYISKHSQTGEAILGSSIGGVQSPLSITKAQAVVDESVINVNHAGTISFKPGSDAAISGTTGSPTSQDYKLAIGMYQTSSAPSPLIFSVFDLKIYELTISENNTPIRHYIPSMRGGTPGLYDTVGGGFISSKTADDVIAIQ